MDTTQGHTSYTHTPLSFLLICDEWSPRRGGISVFNRLFATALAACGHPTTCLVESASIVEERDADSHGVTLLAAESTPSGPNLYIPALDAVRRAPAVVIGHDRVSGPQAWTFARKYCPSLLVHIVHTAPSEIEPYKLNDEATSRIESRERVTRKIATDADVVAAVGPRLTRNTEAIVGDGFGGVPVLPLEPGIIVPECDQSRNRRVPAKPTILMLGRTVDIELKGLDIAAHAVAKLPVSPDRPAPELFIRGAADAECRTLHQTLVHQSGLARDRIDVRPFTEDPEQIGHDLMRAAVCVMPSRAEGFGMSALDAIGRGTPLLLSSKSGAAETLRRLLGRFAEPMVVDIEDDLERDSSNWSRAIQRVLDDLPQAFDYAHEVRARLAGELRWEATVAVLVSRLAPTVRAA